MKTIRYELKPLPYSYDALSPAISKQIMELHHDKHHLAYVNGANTALELLEKSRNGESINYKAVMRDLSFNLNGHILHEIFWNCMQPYSQGNKPSTRLAEYISQYFGSFDNFKKEFSEAGKSVEGSGWVMLSKSSLNELVIHQVEKHNLLSLSLFTPILINDVWEHAYYLDYLNDRGKYIENWWNVVNWSYVEKQLFI